ncbi:MAG: hypothetical protein COB78_05815 [Hyphomicrobiales bacterium]|nr:MAG: hypothetical protein COB78_05815 [Hyphomicrobiales bacterium]
MSALARIHIAKKDLGLDDDTYRAVLVRVTGKSSAGDMSPKEHQAVIDEFINLNWKPGRRNWKAASKKAYVRKIWAIWGDLKKRGIWKSKSRESLIAFVLDLTNRDDPEFLTAGEANKVIEALKAMERRG